LNNNSTRAYWQAFFNLLSFREKKVSKEKLDLKPPFNFYFSFA
jgi:hypothetical protein